MKKLKILILLAGLFTLYSISTFAQGDSPTQETFITKMLDDVGRIVDKAQIHITSSTFTETDQTKTLAGNCDFFNLLNVGFTAKFDQGGLIRRFEVAVPLGPKLSPDNISSIMKSGDWTNLFLPDEVKNSMLMSKYFINFTNTLTIDSVGMQFSYPSPIKIFGLKALQLINISVGYKVANPLTQASLSGTFDADVAWGLNNPVTFSFQTNLVRNPKEWELKFGIGNLSINSVFENFGMTRPPIPPAVNNLLTITSAELAIKPFAYTFLFNGSSPLGDVNFMVKRTTIEGKPVKEDTVSNINTSMTGGYTASPDFDPDPPPKKPEEPVAPTSNYKWGIMAGFSLPEPKEEIKAINFMRKIGLTNIALVISTFDDAVETNLPIFANLGSGNTIINKGFTFIAWIPVDDLLNKYKLTEPLRILAPDFMRAINRANPIRSVMFRAAVSAINISEFDLEGDIVFNDNMVLKIKDVELGRISQLKVATHVALSSQTADLSLSALWSMKLDPTRDPLNFSASIFVKPAVDAGVSFGFSGSMQSNWENMYGIPGISMNSVKFQAGIHFGADLIPYPDDMFLKGQIKYGQTIGDVTLAINPNEITANMLVARVCKLSLSNLVNQFLGGAVKTSISSKASYLKVIQNFLDMELRDVYLKVIPPGAPTSLSSGMNLEADYTDSCKSALNITSNETPGIRIAANGRFAGFEGMFDVGIEGSLSSLTGGITVKAKMSPIRFKANNFTIFELTSADGEAGPELYIDLSTNNIIKGIKGLLSPGAPQPPDYNSDRIFYFNAGVNILNGLFKGRALVELTPTGYSCAMRSRIFGIVDARLNASIRSFRNLPDSSTISVIIDAGNMQDKIYEKLAGPFSDLPLLKNCLHTITFESFSMTTALNGYNSRVNGTLKFKVAGSSFTSTISVKLNDLEDLMNKICDEIKSKASDVFNSIKLIAEQAILLAKQTVDRAWTLAKTTYNQAVATATNAYLAAAGLANTVANATRAIISTAWAKTLEYLRKFGRLTKEIVLKIYKSTIGALIKSVRGGDNTERIYLAGPSYRMVTKFPGMVVKGPTTFDKNLPAVLGARSATSMPMEESWQIIPKEDAEGQFLLVNPRNGLLLTKAWFEKGRTPNFCTLIPHENDHWSREILMMEEVPNEPGWYYLKFFSGGEYLQLKRENFSPDGVTYTSMIMPFPVSTRPVSDSGKFRFEKAGNISMTITNEPMFLPTLQLRELGRYHFVGETEQYKMLGGKLRLVPDAETLTGEGMVSLPSNEITDDMRMGVVFGDPLPSLKTGMYYRSTAMGPRYYIEAGKRKQIPDDATFVLMKVADADVNIIPEADLNRIQLGTAVPIGLLPTIRLVDSAVYRAVGNPTVYMVWKQMLKAFPDDETRRYIGFGDDRIIDITPQNLATLPMTTPIPTRKQWTLVTTTMAGVYRAYVIDHGVKREISAEGTTFLKLDVRQTIRISLDDWKAIPQGPPFLAPGQTRLY